MPLIRTTPKTTTGDRFALQRPLATHWRPATCAEVDCPHYLRGWQTTVDERTSLGQAQARYIRQESGREFHEERQVSGLTVFTFAPGQRCFRQHQHRLPLERDPLLTQSRPGQGTIVLPWPEWAERFNDTMERAARERR